MLQTLTPESKEVAIESKDIALNFDSRIAKQLVVTVRALDPESPGQDNRRRVSVGVSDDSPRGLPLDSLHNVALWEIESLSNKIERFPNSDSLLNYLASAYLTVGESQKAIELLRDGFERSKSDLLRNKLAAALSDAGLLDA